jgi:UDP-N-acetylmuramate dehydrogenase
MTHPGELDALERALGPTARRHHPLGALTTYRVGGTAALFVEVRHEDHLTEVAGAVAGSEVPVLVIGNGSNLLVADRGFDGLVVSLGPGFDDLSIDGDRVRAGAALDLPRLARRTAAAGLTGLEWAVGVPGSVGGAIRMNAGGHGSDTAATLVAYRWVDLTTGAWCESPAERLGLAYRHSDLAATDVVVAGVYRLRPGRPEDGKAAIDDIVRWRRANQPGGSNAGSVFTNPPGDSAGRLIDASGLKGFRIGSAEVSPRHANFIQADAGGSADDVRRVIDHVRSTVAEATGVTLRTEVRQIGFPEDGTTRAGGSSRAGGPGGAE